MGNHKDAERVRRPDRDRETSHQAVVSPKGVITASLEFLLENRPGSRPFEQADQRIADDVRRKPSRLVERHDLGDDRPFVTHEDDSDLA